MSNSEDETIYNYDSPSEYGSDQDNLFSNWTLSSQTAESLFFKLGNLTATEPISLDQFLEVDLNHNQELLWANVKSKLTSPQGLEESKGMGNNVEELELNSEIIETAVLKELSLMVFSCIKSKQPLQELCNQFYNDFNHTITQRQLFLIVFRNCESRLRELLTIAKADYSPIPFLLTKEEMEDEVVQKAYNFPCREVFYSLFKSIPILSITSQEEDFHHRRTKLDILNNIFKTSFEYDTDERVAGKKFQNLVSCEIQFDYYYSLPQFLCFLCPCRKLESATLQKLIQVSNVVFLHWNTTDSKVTTLQYLRNEALKMELKVVVFIQNSKGKKLTIKDKANDSGRGYLEIEHPDFTQVANREVLEQGMKKAVTQYLFKDGKLDIEDNVFKARDSQIARLYGSSFINLCNLFDLDTTDLQQANAAVSALFTEVVEFQGKFRSENLFPLQIEHERLIEMENEIDHCDNPAKRSSLLKNCDNSKEKMRKAELAIFLKKIIDASAVSNFGSVMRLFVMQLKQFITPIVANIRNKTLDVQRRWKLDELGEKEAKDMMRDLELQIQAEQLSWDLLIREIRRVIEFHEQAQNAQYAGVIEKLIHAGEPFEIVEGECLRIPFDKTLQCLGNLATKKTLVVAIIGEQSSGKSTLMNYVWGTQYSTSAGRCTKGIYGTILPLREQDDFDQILLLDTEGIQSIERKDDLFFDRCLCLFLLCVSHLVIINNEGNFREAMKNTVQITLSCWEDLQVQRVNNPSLFFVLNKLSSINPNELAEHIEKLNDQLEGGETLKRLVKSENFQFLPHAFQGTELHLKERKQGEASIETKLIRKQFLDAVAKLKSAILHTIVNQSTKSGHSFTLEEWFRFAKDTWETIRKHKKLVFYSDLREKLDDQLLEEKIQTISKERFCSQEAKTRFEEVTMEMINMLHKAKKSGEVVEPISEEKAVLKFEKEFDTLYLIVDQDFTKFSQDMRLAPRLVTLRRNLLFNQCRTYYLQLLEKGLKRISRENRHLQQGGSGEMNLLQQAQELSKKYAFKTQQEALPFFERVWNDTLHQMEKQINKEGEKEDTKIYDIVMKFYHGKAGGLLPEKNQNFFLLKDAALRDKQKRELKSILAQMKSPLLFFDQDIWQNRTQQGWQLIDGAQELEDEGESQKLFSMKDFFTMKKTHCYFVWTQCWRAQKADDDFCNCVYGMALHHRNTSTKERLDNYLICIEAEAREFGLTLSKSFQKRVLRIATSRLPTDRDTQAANVRWYLLKEYMKEGAVFNRLKLTGNVEATKRDVNTAYMYFTKQHFIKHSDKKPQDNFEIIYLGLKKLLRPVQVDELALEQFLVNFVNRTYSNFGNDQIEKAAQFISEKVRWAKVIHKLDMQLRRILTGFEVEGELEDLTNAEFAEWAFEQNNRAPTIDLSSELMASVTEVVNKTVDLVNKSLRVIAFRVHQYTIGLLHIYAMTQTWVFLKHFSELKRREQKIQSLGTKQFWQEYFLSTLLGDGKNKDTFYARMVIKEIVENLKGDLLQESKDDFKFKAMQTLNTFVERRRLIQELDEKLFIKEEANFNDMYQYIVRPLRVIENNFDRKLKDYTAAHLQAAKDQFYQSFVVETYEMLVTTLLRFYKEVLPKSEADCNALSLFELPPVAANLDAVKNFFKKDIEDIPPTRLFNHYRSAATLFFLSYITQKPLPETFEVKALVESPEGEEQKVVEKKQEVKKAELALLIRSKLKVPVLKDEFKLRPDIVTKIETLFRCEEASLLGITNLKLFLKEILHKLKKEFGAKQEEGKKGESNAHLIPGDQTYLELVKKNYYRKLVGCGELCLKCKRVCDKDHETTNYEVDKHECRLSHQPQCFGGYSWSKSGYSDLSSCESYPNSFVSNIHGMCFVMVGKRKTWGNWKQDQYFKEWNFEFSVDDKYSEIRRQNWNRMKEAWEVAGPRVCKRHSMKFQSFSHPVELHKIPLDPQ